ncbi:MAG: hypothetical protein CMN73_04415 [Sphingomonas sp.]|nr:hypothetical protein [Sphingomonas sp.]|tara:strand:- start:145 stop:354 length:210 start_codon:yes stop_codon:yes gene_type:complete
MKIADLKDGLRIEAEKDTQAGPAGTRFYVREAHGEFYVVSELNPEDLVDLSLFYQGKELIGFAVAPSVS